jgi:hypothetical protein
MILGVCPICNGPIHQGEPVVIYQGGAVCHRFRSTCEQIMDEEWRFMKGVGIS